MQTTHTLSPLRARLDAFLHPFDREKETVLRAHWNALPPELRTANQIAGRHMTHCGFILGASYCSFRCTHCYLPADANQVPIPPLAEVIEQLDANRRLQGPGGGIQITGGDLPDAYWRAGRSEELVAIVHHACRIGLVPMVMTHGQTLLDHPEFLESLMVDGGLRQIAVHIDLTQAGRAGFPIGRIRSETDLHPLREAFTRLALNMREKTGLPLELAHNCTVVRRNVDDVSGILRWFLSSPQRTRIWRIISFQPEADTGRTAFSKEPVTADEVWEKICEGIGFRMRRDASIFGHPDCNSWAPLLVARPSGMFAPLFPDHPGWEALFGKVLERVGSVSTITDDAGTLPWRIAGVIARNPILMARMAGHIVRHIASGKLPWPILSAALRGRIHTVGTGIHNFMDAAQVARATRDPNTQCRLDACVFKGAVKRNGEWEAIPMCAMNENTWSEIYRERRDQATAPAEKSAGAIPSSPP